MWGSGSRECGNNTGPTVHPPSPASVLQLSKLARRVWAPKLPGHPPKVLEGQGGGLELGAGPGETALEAWGGSLVLLPLPRSSWEGCL